MVYNLWYGCGLFKLWLFNIAVIETSRYACEYTFGNIGTSHLHSDLEWEVESQILCVYHLEMTISPVKLFPCIRVA